MSSLLPMLTGQQRVRVLRTVNTRLGDQARGLSRDEYRAELIATTNELYPGKVYLRGSRYLPEATQAGA